MKRLKANRPLSGLIVAILTILILGVASLRLHLSTTHGQVSSQRVLFSSLNPPTVCSPGKLYTNAAQSKVWLGTNTSTCVQISGVGSTGSFTTLATSGASTLASPVTIGVGQTTTATTDLLINPTTKASGNLFDAQVNSVSKFSINSAGDLANAGNITSSGTILAGSGSSLGFTASTKIAAPSNGILEFINNGFTDFTRVQFGGTTSSFPALARSTVFLKAQLADGTEGGGFLGTTYNTVTNCLDSAGAAACGSATAGSFVIDAATTSTVVSTTSITANSQIFVQEDSSLGTRLGITCNTQSILVLGTPVVTARTAGTSFTASIVVGPTATPMCLSYHIVN